MSSSKHQAMRNCDWDSPQCLIYSAGARGLEIDWQTIELLERVKVPVTVVAIAGPYRTGKSYLMNRLAGADTGFDIGSTIEAETKGIWAWCKPHPFNAGQCLLLLDTEGLGDPNKGDENHDMQIFTLAVLLSTSLVYNSMATIGQKAINDLQFVSQISEHLKIRSQSPNDQENLDGYFPNFVWAVRDFSLQLSLGGELCTADDYMEHALKLKHGSDPITEEYNQVRKGIRRHFPSRKCFCFPRPMANMKKMWTPESLTESDFDEDFLETSALFIVHVLTNSKTKSINGVAMNGSVAGLCEQYVKQIQAGGIPCIENTVEAVSKAENRKAVEEALRMYRQELREMHLPTETVEQLSGHHQQCQKKAIAVFMNASMFDVDHKFQAKLTEDILNEYKTVFIENEQVSLAKCQEILRELYAPILRKKQSGAYAQPGYYVAYKRDMEDLQERYHAAKGKGLKAAEKLNEFLNAKRSEFNEILETDRRLTDTERQIEEKRKNAEEARMREEVAEAEQEKMERLLSEMERSHQENTEQLKMKLKEEMNTRLEEQEAQIDKRLKEQQEMFFDGFRDESEFLRKQIEDLQDIVEKQQMIEAKRQTTTTIESVGKVIVQVLGVLAPLVPQAIRLLR